jgi:galactosyl transferase GMA12/MNN10 family
MIRNRSPWTTRTSPLDSVPLVASKKTNGRERRGNGAGLSAFVSAVVATPRVKLVFALLLLVLVLHESVYYYVLNQRVNLPGTPYFGLSSKALLRTTPTDSHNNASMAIFSLHRSYKFAGYLGTWLNGNKALYAARHGYQYFHQDHFAAVADMTTGKASLPPLSPWQSATTDRRIKYDKLRFIWYILEHNRNVQYGLWLDGDTVVANADIAMEDRINELEQQWQETTTRLDKDQSLLFVWTRDGNGPNAGVMLLRNCAETRDFLLSSLRDTAHHTRADETFLEQSSMTRTVEHNATYRDGQLLLSGNRNRQLQSRVRGPADGLYQPGDWIIHLPNHNRVEFLFSLVRWVGKW